VFFLPLKLVKNRSELGLIFYFESVLVFEIVFLFCFLMQWIGLSWFFMCFIGVLGKK
jgi:hypothetical protein